MTHRSESYFASLALVLLLALVLFYGCRAFDPEPVIVNRPPETFILGAPAETTGTRFLRHMYWYGTDSDGDVVRFIYAITDSTVQDPETLDVDEEDRLFDPADDVTTLDANEERRIGYTTKTDSVFLFPIDRKDTTSKDITFHIVAVDDRGRLDPTPARLHFFNNSLGNPVLEFTVSTWETLSGGGEAWIERWVGTPAGPDVARSPELTASPVVGFSRRFKIDWTASSPNGAVTGFRYRADQGVGGSFVPANDLDDEKQWSPALTSFTYLNDVPPDDFDNCLLDPLTGQIVDTAVCPPDSVRWPSDNYRISVEALDVALVQSEESAGILRFDVNYSPETQLVDDATWPLYRIPDGLGGFQEFPLTPTDTIPMNSYAVFNFSGFDKTESLVAPATFGELCCDVIESDSRVGFQARYEALMDKGRFVSKLVTRLSDPFRASTAPGDVDTIGFNVGPFAYSVFGVARDEHGRVDSSPERYDFVAGLQPRLVDVIPDSGDSLIITNPNIPRWPRSLDYVASPRTLWWTGQEFVDDELKCQDPLNCASESGTLFQFQARFTGAPHPLEPDQAVRSWQFRYFTENDAINRLSDGLESKDFSTWEPKPLTPNEWFFNTTDEAIEIFVPSVFWFIPKSFYEPSSGDFAKRAQGRWMVQRLGEALLEVRGRTSAPGDEWSIYQGVRPPEEPVLVDYQEGGRRTRLKSIQWSLYLGVDSDSDGRVDRFWPDFPLSDY